MYNDLTPIDKNKHQNMGVKKITDMNYANKTNLAPTHLDEIQAVVISYPVIFVGEDKVPVAVLGLEDGQNLLVDESGRWLDHFFIPGYIRRYPFAFVHDEVEKKASLSIDNAEEMLTDDNPMIPLFEGDEISDKAKQVLKDCGEFQQSVVKTVALTKQIDQAGLFVSKTISYGEEKKSIGFIGIDEKKFNALSDEEFGKLRASGALTIIYAHLFSIANWSRLTTMGS